MNAFQVWRRRYDTSPASEQITLHHVVETASSRQRLETLKAKDFRARHTRRPRPRFLWIRPAAVRGASPRIGTIQHTACWPRPSLPPSTGIGMEIIGLRSSGWRLRNGQLTAGTSGSALSGVAPPAQDRHLDAPESPRATITTSEGKDHVVHRHPDRRTASARQLWRRISSQRRHSARRRA